jgi:hypothetical protein
LLAEVYTCCVIAISPITVPEKYENLCRKWRSTDSKLDSPIIPAAMAYRFNSPIHTPHNWLAPLKIENSFLLTVKLIKRAVCAYQHLNTTVLPPL